MIRTWPIVTALSTCAGLKKTKKQKKNKNHQMLMQKSQALSDQCAFMKFTWNIIILLITNCDIYLKNQLKQ